MYIVYYHADQCRSNAPATNIASPPLPLASCFAVLNTRADLRREVLGSVALIRLDWVLSVELCVGVGRIDLVTMH